MTYHLITVVLAFAGSWLALAVRGRSIARRVVAQQQRAAVETQAYAANFRRQFDFFRAIARELDSILPASSGLSHREVIEELRRRAREHEESARRTADPYGPIFQEKHMVWIAAEDIGFARALRSPPTFRVRGANPISFEERVALGLDRLAELVLRLPEYGKQLTPRDIAREIGFAAPLTWEGNLDDLARDDDPIEEEVAEPSRQSLRGSARHRE